MTKRKTEAVNDLSRCLDPLDMDATVIAVIEMSQSSWLVAGIVPGVERQPLKKIAIDQHALLKLLSRWREEAEKKGHKITRVTVAFEAGHDGFWLARRLAALGIEVHVIHASSVAVTREHHRAKTDRLDTEILKRGFLGWLRGERGHRRTPSGRAGSARRSLAKPAALSLGSRRRSSGSVFAASTRSSRRPPSASGPYAHPRVSRSRRIRWLRSSAIWSATRSSRDKSARSSRRGSITWRKLRQRAGTPWCCCWPASSASVSRRPTCWCRRCCGGTCGIGAP